MLKQRHDVHGGHSLLMGCLMGAGLVLMLGCVDPVPGTKEQGPVVVFSDGWRYPGLDNGPHYDTDCTLYTREELESLDVQECF